MARPKADFRELVHTPAQLGQAYVQYAERVQGQPGVPFGIPALDKRIIPIQPGNLVSIIARPGHGKTTLLAYLARAEARRIVERGKEAEEAVVYVTWEESAEELEAFFQADSNVSSSDIAWGRADLERVHRSAIKRANVPIWVIGYGIGRAGRNAPRMTIDAVLGALETMEEDFGVRPVLMLFDYIQLVPVLNIRDKVQQVTEAPNQVKELALRVGAPAVCGVQAGRDVDKREVKIPEMQDAQWASSIEQTSDKVLSLLRPIRYLPSGGQFEVGWLDHKPRVPVTESLFVIRLLKQRFEQGRYTWLMHFEPQYLKLAEMELYR